MRSMSTIAPPIKFANSGGSTSVNFGTSTFTNFITANTNDLFIQSSGLLTPLSTGSESSILTATGSGATWQSSTLSTHTPLQDNHIAYNTTTKRFTNAGRAYLQAYKTSSQTFTQTPSTALFNSISQDTTSSYNALTGIFTVPSTGFYIITLAARFTGQVNTAISIDGTTLIARDANENTWHCHLFAVHRMTASQQLSIICTSNTVINRAPVDLGVGASWHLIIYKLA